MMAGARLGYEMIRSEVAKGCAGRKRAGRAERRGRGRGARGPGEPGEQGWAILLSAI